MDRIKFHMEKILVFVKEFSKVPGSREMDEGRKSNSGEEFRIKFLEPAFLTAREKKIKVTVDLDGTIGYGTSWLEEVFGGLARIYGTEKVQNTLEIVSREEPYLVDDINAYIDEAENE